MSPPFHRFDCEDVVCLWFVNVLNCRGFFRGMEMRLTIVNRSLDFMVICVFGRSVRSFKTGLLFVFVLVFTVVREPKAW